MSDRSCITLVRCNKVCIWMNEIRKLYNKSIIFKNENVWILSCLFYYELRLNLDVCSESVFWLRGVWYWLDVWSWVDVSLTMVPANFCPRVGEIPAAGLSLREGKSLQRSLVRALAFDWGKSHQRSCDSESQGGNLCVRVRSLSGRNRTTECLGRM